MPLYTPSKFLILSLASCFAFAYFIHNDLVATRTDTGATIGQNNAKNTPAVPMLSQSASETIRFGHLPGYTGWARPSHSDAAFYQVLNTSLEDRSNEFSIQIGCVSCFSSGRHGTSKPYIFARMYGPAILTGRIRYLEHNELQITFLPPLAGSYTVEVVMEFSNPHSSMDHYPLKNEPAYEGYLLPQFPMKVEISTSSDDIHHNNDRPCSSTELTISDSFEGLQKEYWAVVGNVNSRHSPTIEPDNSPISLVGYQEATNALGIQTDLRFRNCYLPTPEQSVAGLAEGATVLHMVFIGDSVMRLQKQYFRKLASKQHLSFRITLLTTHGGISQTYTNITRDLQDLARSIHQQTNPPSYVVVLFNSGLHDVAQLCSQQWASNRKNYIPIPDENFSCSNRYRHVMHQLIKSISEFPSDLTIFQTTTAGWPKYGNFGFAWPPSEGQPFPLSTHFCHYFNEIALEVLHGYGVEEEDQSPISIVDGYWLTRARPDNREVDIDNAIGKHLVHPGTQVVRGMVQVWTALVQEHLHTSRTTKKMMYHQQPWYRKHQASNTGSQ